MEKTTYYLKTCKKKKKKAIAQYRICSFYERRLVGLL